METLIAIGMLVGLMKSHAPPPPQVTAPVEQRQAEADKARPRKKSEWLLSY